MQTAAQALTVTGGVSGASTSLKSANASPQFQQRSKSASSTSSLFNHNLSAAAVAAAASNTAAAFALDASNLATPEIFSLNFAELTQTLSKQANYI